MTRPERPAPASETFSLDLPTGADDVDDTAFSASSSTWPAAVGADTGPPVVAGYEIVDRLGSGGMSTVYEAIQLHPRRRVALKIIHPELVSRGARRWFRSEVEVLAGMEHPDIPAVYAAGEQGGLLYMTMALVEGQPVDRWVEQARPPVPVVLALLARAAEAVHHAHLRGVVHRDIKPANVLVTPTGEPRVLDFGIAAALDPQTARTREGQVAGTLAYMSPEQLRGERIDGRTDVWALGVLLYELLLGRRLFPEEAEHGRAMPAMRARHAAFRPPQVGTERPELRGDVEAILARALAPDRHDRYPSAADLAADLRRHLDHLPVSARPASPAYVAGRFLRRHWLVVSILGLSFGALAAATLFSVHQHRLAEQARSRAEAERAAALEALAEGEEEVRRKEQVTEFLGTMLSQAHPDETVGREPTVYDVIATATAQLDRGELHDAPEVEATLRRTLASVYYGLGRRAESEAQLAAVVALYEAGRLPRESEVWAGTQRDRAAVVRALTPAERRAAIDESLALERARHGPRHPHVAEALLVKGRTLRGEGRIAEATRHHRDAVELLDADGGDVPTDLQTTAWNQLALVLRAQGQGAEAFALQQRALAVDVQTHGAEHPQVATDYCHMSTARLAMQDAATARALADRCLELRARLLPPGHTRIDGARHQLGQALLALGALDEAEVHLREARAALASDPGEVTEVDADLVALLLAQGRPQAALPLAERLVTHHQARFGEAHYRTWQARGALGRVHLALGDEGRARALLLPAYDALVVELSDQAPLARALAADVARLR